MDKMNEKKYIMQCDAGNYMANSFWGLGWTIFKHRLWHLWRGDGFID
jgi:hypothetical protein